MGLIKMVSIEKYLIETDLIKMELMNVVLKEMGNELVRKRLNRLQEKILGIFTMQVLSLEINMRIC